MTGQSMSGVVGAGVLAAVAVACVLLPTAQADCCPLAADGTCEAQIDGMFPFGDASGDMVGLRADDQSTQLNMNRPFHYFGSDHDTAYINSNGVISFDYQVTTFTPSTFPFSGGRPIVAPFWADLDPECGHSPNGAIHFRESTATSDLALATQQVSTRFPNAANFQADWTLVATWYKQRYFYRSSGVPQDLTNTFQCILVQGQDSVAETMHTFAIFNYHDINWLVGSASGGGPNGLCLTGEGTCTPAQIGFDQGDGINFFSLAVSQTYGVLNLASMSNVNVSGQFIYQIGGVEVGTTPDEPDRECPEVMITCDINCDSLGGFMLDHNGCFVCICVDAATPTRSPSFTPTRTPSRTPTSTPTQRPTHTPSSSPMATHTPSSSPMATRTPSRTPTRTPTNSPTRSPTRTPTRSTSTTTRTPSSPPSMSAVATASLSTGASPSTSMSLSNPATTSPIASPSWESSSANVNADEEENSPVGAIAGSVAGVAAVAAAGAAVMMQKKRGRMHRASIDMGGPMDSDMHVMVNPMHLGDARRMQSKIADMELL